jgi:S1-C subfamily serine protease
MTDGPWVQTVARARKGVVRVISPRASGSGYFAHANGVIVTSQSLVEYEPAVTIVADDGKRVEARVVRVDVRRDLAFLLPRELITPHPLHEVPTAPRLGEPVAVLAQCANGAVVLPSVVAALTRSSEGWGSPRGPSAYGALRAPRAGS